MDMVEALERVPIVILPGTDELNRGDQALVWQTKAIAESAGFAGQFYMLSNPDLEVRQSRSRGILPLVPILRHPRARYAPKSNLRYGFTLTLIWGLVAGLDTLRSLGLLTRMGRKLLRPFLSENERTTLDKISSSSACFVKGGGFLHSTASVTDAYKGYFFLFHVMLALSLGKQVFVMPNSFGPFDGRIYRKIVTSTLKRCSLVTARESISNEALAQVGISAREYPDLAFTLPAQKPDMTTPIEEVRRANPGKPVVGITARPYRFPGSVDPARDYAGYVAELAKFIGNLREDGFLPVFIEHVISEGTHESDRAAIDAIRALPEAADVPIVSLPELNCAELKFLYGECDFVVGTRFHSVIFALSEETPALAIAYGGNKGVGIMRDAGLEDFVSPIQEFTADTARVMFRSLAATQGISQRLRDLRAAYGVAHDELAAQVRSVAGMQ